MKFNELHDIAVTLGVESVDYPNDPLYEVGVIASLENGDVSNLSRIRMTPHLGTHIDVPAHFVQGGRTVDSYTPADFILAATVVDTDDQPLITADTVSGCNVEPGEAVLFRTRNSKEGLSVSAKFNKKYVALSGEAADACVERELKLVGIDYISIDPYGNPEFPAHHALLGNGTLILEGINLADVAPGRYTLICLPLKFHNLEASPVRAILIR